MSKNKYFDNRGKNVVKLNILDLTCSSENNQLIAFFNSVYGRYLDSSKFEIVRTKDRSEEEICEIVKGVDILLTDPSHLVKVTRKIIESGRQLKLIQCQTVGYDEIDVKAAREYGIPVANSAGINAVTVAEHVIMAALYLLKSIRYAHDELSKGRWVGLEIAT